MDSGCGRFPPLSLPSTWVLLSMEADKMMESASARGLEGFQRAARCPAGGAGLSPHPFAFGDRRFK